MTAGDFAAIVVTFCVIVAMTVLVFVLFQLLTVLRDLREAAARLADEAGPTLEELRTTVDVAEVELQRLQGVIDTAEQLSGGLASASRTASRVVATPAIKSKALAAGAGRAGVR